MAEFFKFFELFDLTPSDVVMIPVGALMFVAYWHYFGAKVIAPFYAVVRAREEATTGADERAVENLEKSRALLTEYEDALTEERVKAMRVKLEALSKAKDQADIILGAAEKKAQDDIRAARAELAAKLRTLREDALREADGLATLMSDKAKSAFSVQ